MAEESNLGFDIAKMVEDLSVDDGGLEAEGKRSAKKVAKLLVKLAPAQTIDGVANTLAKEFARNVLFKSQYALYVEYCYPKEMRSIRNEEIHDKKA